jgi:hypothetical protein
MNIKEWRGLRAKRPVFVLLTPQETGEGEKIGAAALGGAWPATLGRGGGREEGENRPGGAGIRFPSPISEEGARNGGAMAASGGLRPACAAAALRGSNGGRG